MWNMPFEATTITAERLEEPSTISNVVDYLSSYMVLRNTEISDSSKTVLWSKFERCDHNDGIHKHGSCDPVMVIGTETSLQVYKLMNDGKLHLLFSKNCQNVNSATVLPSPEDLSCDIFEKDRPLIVVAVDSRLSFYSMRSGRCVKEVLLKTEIVDICGTAGVIVASSCTELVLLNAGKLVVMTTITNCRLSTNAYTPVAHSVSEHWLAYAEDALNPAMISVGGDLSDPSDKPYALSLLDIKKKMTTTLVSEDGDRSLNEERGVVTILCLNKVSECLSKSNTLICDAHIKSQLMIAHFIAHQLTSVTKMVFDSTGSLLLTTCEQGLFCHLFRIVPHPTNCNQSAVLHLYRLHRGDIPRSVVSLAISKDCRLVAAASDHGTIHIWPTSSYGGPLTVRTHCQGHVVNRLSRFERSAGMHEYQVTRPHTISVTNSIHATGDSNHSLHYICPRLPPLPSPCTLYSFIQLKPFSSLPLSKRPLSLVPFFFSSDTIAMPSSYTRTEWILILSPDSRLLQYALNIHPDPESQISSNRTELDGPFVIDKRSLFQWRFLSLLPDCFDHTPVIIPSHHQSRNTTQCIRRREVQTAMLQSVIPDFTECLEQSQRDNVTTSQCWFSNIEISSQIRSTSGIKRMERFSISSYQSKEPSDVRLEALVKSPSISSSLSNNSWRSDDKQKEDVSSQPMRVPYSEQRIKICNSFCGSSISDSLPSSTDNVIFALAHAIQDDDGTDEQILDNWDDSKTGYIEIMTRDMSHVRLRRVSGSFSSDIVRLPFLSTSPTNADIPEERYSQVITNNKVAKQVKRQEKKKRKS